MQILYPRFSITEGTLNHSRKLSVAVIERKNGRVVQVKQFGDDRAAADRWVQSQVNIERDFRMG